MAQKKTITIRVVPLSGEPVEHTVPFKRGMTVAQALEAAGVSTERKDISVRATPGQKLEAGTTVIATEHKLTAESEVTVTERPQGS